MYNDWILQLLK